VSPQLILQTSDLINNFLHEQNQKESYISREYVKKELHQHRMDAFLNGVDITDKELASQVSQIIIRNLRAIILLSQRHKNDEQFLYRPNDMRRQDISGNTAMQIPARGEYANRKKKTEGELPDRFIRIS